MPKQEFKYYTDIGLPGEEYGLATTNSQRLTFKTSRTDKYPIKYGDPVSKNIDVFNDDYWDGGVRCGIDLHEKDQLYYILGVVLRESKLESDTKPGNGDITIHDNYDVAVIMSGAVLVKLHSDITTCEIGADWHGRFGFGKDAGYCPLYNVKALKYPAKAGDIIPILITQFGTDNRDGAPV